MTRKTKKTKNKFNFKIIFTLVVIAIILLCLIYNVILLFINPTDTFMIENGNISSSEQVNGYVIREEKLFQGENYKNGISQIKAEGQKVAKGDPIFRYYTNNEENLVKKIADLDKQIQEAIEEGNRIYSSDITVLEKQIENNLELITTTNKLSDINEYKKTINTALTKKSKLIGELSPSGSYIKKLVSQRTKCEEKLNSGSEYINATVSGIVSYKIDGLEESLTPDNLENLTQDYLEDLKLKSGNMIPTSEEKGKIVNNFYCYIATVFNSEEARRAEINDKVSLILSTGDKIKAEIEYISEEDDERRLIVFKVTNCVDKLIDYRKVSFDVVWWSVNGLKVPNTSILKEDGKNYIIRKRVGYSDKILVKVLEKSKNYSIIENYTSLELKELGYSVNEIRNMKIIGLYDEILLKATK